jgi:hypothetical protein
MNSPIINEQTSGGSKNCHTDIPIERAIINSDVFVRLAKQNIVPSKIRNGIVFCNRKGYFNITNWLIIPMPISLPEIVLATSTVLESKIAHETINNIIPVAIKNLRHK